MLQSSDLCVESSPSIGLLFGSSKLDRLVGSDVVDTQALAELFENLVVGGIDCCLQRLHLLLMPS